VYNFRFSRKIYIAVPWQSVAALLTHILLLKAGDAKNILYLNRRLCSMHFVFDIFVSSFFHYVLCSVSHCGSLQCSIAFSFFISEHTSSSSQHTRKTAIIIVGITTALVISLFLVTLYWFNLQWKEIPLKRNCFKLVECKNNILHFVFKHAYITLILFALLKLCSAPPPAQLPDSFDHSSPTTTLKQWHLPYVVTA